MPRILGNQVGEILNAKLRQYRCKLPQFDQLRLPELKADDELVTIFKRERESGCTDLHSRKLTVINELINATTRHEVSLVLASSMTLRFMNKDLETLVDKCGM